MNIVTQRPRRVLVFSYCRESLGGEKAYGKYNECPRECIPKVKRVGYAG